MFWPTIKPDIYSGHHWVLRIYMTRTIEVRVSSADPSKLEEIRGSPKEERSSRYRIKNGISTIKRCGTSKDLGMTWGISRLQAETPIFVSVNCTRIYLTNSVLECKYMYHVYWHLYRLSLLCSWALQSSLAAFPTSAAGDQEVGGQVSTAVYILVCSRLQIYKKDAMVCSVCAFFFMVKNAEPRAKFLTPPPYIFENG